MSINLTNPTVGVCRPLYYEEYFVFDREDLLTVSTSSDRTSVRNSEGSSIELYSSETRTVTVSITLHRDHTSVAMCIIF